ncbi:MAG: sigma-54-dependent Fis family transcriptional regulator [Deltaproteobacteria bacterium]|nr:sigma-54-dependent Fis family transcriptional regulator [Deltaproteobacteria bacterium]
MNKEANRLLVVDDEEVALTNLVYVLKKEGYSVTGCMSGPDAVRLLEKHDYDLVITDLKMEKVDGMGVLGRAKELHPDTEVLMITGYATVDSAIEAMKAGAFHYIAKPYKLDEVRKVVHEALEKTGLKKENKKLREHLKVFYGETRLVTNNPQMLKLLRTAEQVAQTDSNVVLCGESGTGKELVARLIHSVSPRKNGQLLSINCGAFSEELLTNELFGHEKGAFTGATAMKKGLIEMADGGTLFLDEVTEMSLTMQVKLLRALQEKEILRVGSTTPVKVDVRFISATNRNLQEEVQAGHFRHDLYFRINVVSLTLPPLVDRKDDIPLLVSHFLKKYATLTGKQVESVSQEVLDILMRYDFPGNIRELENIIERGVALTDRPVIEASHLPDDLRGMALKTFRRKDSGEIPTLDEQEQAYILWVLQETAGNKTLAAKMLGIDRVSLWRKLKKYGLEADEA